VLNAGQSSSYGGAPYNQANYIAERYPADITVFFLHGGTANAQQGGGFSWGDWTFVLSRPLMPGCGPGNDVVHLAHELGHYLGLAHTHVGNGFPTKAEAETAFNEANCNSSIFDGDGLDDTNDDPLVGDMSCDTTWPTIWLRCNRTGENVAHYPSKDNVMSYWLSLGWPDDKTLSTSQVNRIESHVSTSSLRKRLE
jgi:hypothetical protein